MPFTIKKPHRKFEQNILSQLQFIESKVLEKITCLSSKAEPSQLSSPYLPILVGVIHSLALCWLPPPQVAEHSDHSDHGAQVGQGFSLQGTVWFLSPDPPHWEGSRFLGKVHSLILDLKPPSHEAEHSDHSVQSVHFGQTFSLQFLCSSKGCLHGLSFTAFLDKRQSLILFWVPPPQDTEHFDHSVQGVSEGQLSTLHFSVTSFCPIHLN